MEKRPRGAMLELPKNRILKKLLYATTIAVVLCYAWLTARLLEPAFVAPPTVATSVFSRSGDQIGFFEDVAREYPEEAVRLSEDLDWVALKLQLIGQMNPTLRVVVSLERADRLVVTADRVEIGRAVLKAKGQLKKAVLKAWLLQRVSPDVANSFLRLDVASDVLLAILDGGLSLGSPGTSEVAEYETSTAKWWSYADSYQGFCKGAWKSLEVQALCGKELAGETAEEEISVSALSFRAFLGNQIWESYLATPLSKREAFARAWLAGLQPSHKVADSESVETVSGMSRSAAEFDADAALESSAADSTRSSWSLRLQSELDRLLPRELDPRADDRLKWSEKLDAPVIVIDEKGRVAAPGTLKVATQEIAIEKAKLAVLSACAPPTLKMLASLGAKAPRAVWKPSCVERENQFVQVRPSSIQLALKKGLAKASDKLDEFISRESKKPGAVTEGADFLGIKDAKWDETQRLYVVKGAIEAIESFRL